jgi:hypothetical protein
MSDPREPAASVKSAWLACRTYLLLDKGEDIHPDSKEYVYKQVWAATNEEVD